MKKQKFYNDQHVAKEDLDQIYLDVEDLEADHIFDFHYSREQFVLGNPKYSYSSLRVLAQPFESLTVQISGGVGYQNQSRIEVEDTQQFTISSVPQDLGGGLNISRIDLLYLTITESDIYPYSVDFIDANRNIYQQTVYTRTEPIYEFHQLQGIYNPAGASKPSIPPDGIALAYIHLRDNTNKIYNSDTSTLNEGYIEDARTLIFIPTNDTLSQMSADILALQTHDIVLDGQVVTLTNNLATTNSNLTITNNNLVITNNNLTTTSGNLIVTNNNLVIANTNIATISGSVITLTPISGSGAPNITPAFIGQTYEDTFYKKDYKATGTSSVNDWEVNNYAPKMGMMNTGVNSAPAHSANVLDTYKVSAYVNGTISTVAISFYQCSLNAKMKVAIYASLAGNSRPTGAPLSVSSEVIGTGEQDRIYQFTLLTPLHIVAGTTYWIALLSDTTLYYFRQITSGRTSMSQYYANAYVSGFPTISTVGTANMGFQTIAY